MKRGQSHINFKNGFSLVEVILSGSIFALFSTVLIGAYLYGQESAVLAGNRARAILLAEEGIEAARNIRDENFLNLTAGTYGLSVIDNKWSLSGSSDITGIFTRYLTISDIDQDRKSVASTVTWQQNPVRSGTVTIPTRLTYWRKAINQSKISLIGSLSASGNSITIPLHEVGDLLVIFAYRENSNTVPSLPSGWTNIASGGGSNNSSRLAYRVATATNDPSGTWSNANGLVAHVYRGQSTSTPVGGNSSLGGGGSVVTYPALSMVQTNSSSWVTGFAGRRSGGTTIQSAPNQMINRTSFSGNNIGIAGHDTNSGVTVWNAVDLDVGGTRGGWRAHTLEIISQ
jgi:hypothetical protein